MERPKLWRKKAFAHDPKYINPSFKHGGSSVMAWACMAPSGTGSLIFIDDISQDSSSRMNFEVYRRNLLSANSASDLTGRNFIMRKDNNPKRSANTNKNLIWGKIQRFYTGQVNDLTITKLSMHFISRRGEKKAPKTNNN